MRGPERWRLFETREASPELAMGLDEALLEAPGAPPTLRFYTWRPAALSLGYFQSPADVPASARATALVRRLTGGGAIHHGAELTFSIAVQRAHPLYRGRPVEGYARVHRAIAAALATLGVRATLRGATPARSDRDGTGMCFHRSTELDLVLDGAKLVGSAQRRRAGRVLHHGSIKLGPDPLEPGIPGLAAAGADVPPAEVARRVADAFARAFALDLVPSEPSPEEAEQARRRGRRYVDPAFVHAREASAVRAG